MRLQNNDFVRLLRRLEPRPAWRWHASIVCTRTPIRGAFGFVRDFVPQFRTELTFRFLGGGRLGGRGHASIVCTRTPIRGAFGFVRDFGCYGPTPKIDLPVPVRPDRRWRILKLLHVVDEHTREAPAIRCERRIDSDATAAVLESP